MRAFATGIISVDTGRGSLRLWDRDPLTAHWIVAELEARIAYEEWCLEGGQDTYAAYRAAADRADAAQDALAAAATRRG